MNKRNNTASNTIDMSVSSSTSVSHYLYTDVYELFLGKVAVYDLRKKGVSINIIQAIELVMVV